MKLLLYCVGRRPAEAWPPVAGVGGQPVTAVPAGRLAGAVSWLEEADLVPSVPRLLEYEKAVEALFARLTLVPMRYGSSFADEAGVARHLEEHGGRLEALLAELDGCAEMGVRIIGPDDGRAPAAPAPPPDPGPTAGAGRAYLEAQRQRFEALDSWSAADLELAERYSRALGDLAVRHKLEPPGSAPTAFERLRRSLGARSGERAAADGSRLLASLHFLVKRTDLPAFKERFSALAPAEPAELVLSGPWPPYNFASP